MREDLAEVIGKRLDHDARKAAAMMPRDEARYMVNLYYDLQKVRIQSGNQVAANRRDGRPTVDTLGTLNDGMLVLEKRIVSILNVWCREQDVGAWSLHVKGIGPVLGSGLLAHIDIRRARTAGAIWRFAGLDPTLEWGKGEKRPWNAQLKTLCWKVGESFVKVSGHDDSIYGHLYRERKALEEQKNDNGDHAGEAQRILAGARPPGKTTDAYKALTQGRLPQAQIHARARRYAVKIFLSHWHECAWRVTFNQAGPVPFPIAQQGHAHVIGPEVPYPALTTARESAK